MQIKVNGNSLDNGSWRRMLGQIHIAQSGDGLKVVSVNVIVQGSTAEELNTRWASTKSDFETDNGSVMVWVDSSATTPTEDIGAADGTHNGNKTRLTFDATKTQTGLSIVATFTCFTMMYVPSGTARRFIKFTGQKGELTLIRSWGGGRTPIRTVAGTFTTTFNADAHVGFTFTSISSNGGKARFVMVGALPTFKVGMKLIVTGSTNHNGPHIITAISGQNVDTLTVYSATDTGSAKIGSPTTGYENYYAARNTLLTTYLLVDTDGGRLGTEGLALSGESIKELDPDGYTLEFSLSSEWMQIDLSALPSVRKFQMSVTEQKPELWQGPDKPTFLVGEGTLTVDKEAAATTSLTGMYESVKSAIKAEVERQTGKSATHKIIEIVTTDASAMVLAFKVMFTTSEVINYKRTEVWSFSARYFMYRDAEGYDMLQRDPGDDDCVVAVTVERQGFTAVDLAPFAAAPAGSFIPMGAGFSVDDPEETPQGEQIIGQSYSRSYRKVKLRSSGIRVGKAQIFTQ